MLVAVETGLLTSWSGVWGTVRWLLVKRWWRTVGVRRGLPTLQAEDGLWRYLCRAVV